MEHATRCPGLRYVRTQILDWKCAWPTLDARIQLRQAMAHEVTGCLADVARDACRLGREAVALEAEGDDAVVVRPHRAELVRERVVSGIFRRKRANTPAAPHVWLEQALNDSRGVLGTGDAAPQAMTSVGDDGLD